MLGRPSEPDGATAVPAGVPRRRLRHRIPVRVRQHWKLLAVCAAFLAMLTLVFGTERVRPYVSSTARASDEVTVDIAGDRDLFDPTVPHSISLTYREADYERMLDALFEENEKEYLEADLTIDGTMVPSVGIRLKGNSTLTGLTRDGQPRPRGRGPGGPGRVDELAGPGGPAGVGGPGGPAGVGEPAGPRNGRGLAGPGRADLAAEQPENLPWLISFDEFVAGRRYQGHREIAVRVGGMGGGTAVLNEALSLALLNGVGEPTQRYAYASFTVNDRPTTARLVVEHPDDHFAERLGDRGVLYKALASGQFTDQGDDPTAYQDDFKQVTMKGSQDLQPVIDLIRWVDGADDAEFDAHLADRIDVASFARYVAMQNLLLNFDDMAGPGRNYYLWYDLGTKKFRVISWDHNLTFSGNADQGPHDAGRMGGAPPRAGGPAGGDVGPGLRPPGGVRPPGGFQPPGGIQPPGGDAGRPGAGTDPRGNAARGGGMRAGHVLKERFLASDAFKGVYEDAYRELYQQVYGGGRALAALDGIVKVLATVDGYQAESGTGEADRLRALIQQRSASLATNEVIARD